GALHDVDSQCVEQAKRGWDEDQYSQGIKCVQAVGGQVDDHSPVLARQPGRELRVVLQDTVDRIQCRLPICPRLEVDHQHHVLGFVEVGLQVGLRDDERHQLHAQRVIGD